MKRNHIRNGVLHAAMDKWPKSQTALKLNTRVNPRRRVAFAPNHRLETVFLFESDGENTGETYE
jgi:hypothetical protein